MSCNKCYHVTQIVKVFYILQLFFELPLSTLPTLGMVAFRISLTNFFPTFIPIEAVYSSEIILTLYQTRRCLDADDTILHGHEHLKSHISIYVSLFIPPFCSPSLKKKPDFSHRQIYILNSVKNKQGRRGKLPDFHCDSLCSFPV